MKFSDAYFLTLRKIYWLAHSIQAEIQAFQPDLLVVLARGGLAPLWALQAYWEVTRAEHCPPVVVTNLGREKLLRYEYHRKAIGVNFWPEIEPFDFFGVCERGCFLAWLARQTDWRAELRRQIETGLGGARQLARILVIDDTANKRYTTLIALGLLLAEFPAAETRMVAGDLPDWRPDLSAPWLSEHRARRSHPEERKLMDSVFNLAHGVSDVDPATLQWEPLHTASLAMQKYGQFLPVETWLDLPVWLKTQITTFIHQSSDQPVEPLVNPKPYKKQENMVRPFLEPEELLYRQRWLSADITPEVAAEELDMSVGSAVQLLQNLQKDPE